MGRMCREEGSNQTEMQGKKAALVVIRAFAMAKCPQIIGERPSSLRDLRMLCQFEDLEVVDNASVWVLHCSVEAESLLSKDVK